MWVRSMIIGALCASFALASVAPAFADDDWRDRRAFQEHRREEWREQQWHEQREREHAWHERQEREQQWRERPGFYAPAPFDQPQVYAPPPAFYFRGPHY